MSTKQNMLSLGSILILGLLASPCAAQIFYVRDAAGYLRPVVIPQTTTFSMGMAVQAVVSGDGTSVRLNVTPFGGSMIDPTTTVFQVQPAPNIAIFDGGIRQPAFMSLKPLVLGVQGQQGMFNQGNFAGQAMSPLNPFGQFQSNPLAVMSMQSNPFWPGQGMFGQVDFFGQPMWDPFGQFQSNPFAQMSMQSTSPWQSGAWPVSNTNSAVWQQPNRLGPMSQRGAFAPSWSRPRIR